MAWAFLVVVAALATAEITVWTMAADLMGGAAVVGLTLLSVVAGSILLRRVGLTAALEMRARMERGEPPGPALFDGLCLALAALLLMLPGLVSDALALLLVLPPVRARLLRAVSSRFRVSETVAGMGMGAQPGRPAGPTVIDGEYEIIPPESSPPPPAGHKRLEP